MRFPHQPGLIAGVVITVSDLRRAERFWREVLRPLGYGRIGGGSDWILWAREGAQLLMREGAPTTAATRIMLRAPSREVVDALHREATAQIWRVIAPPAEQPYGPGYYSCIIADPDGIHVELVHAWSELPEEEGAERVQVSGVDGVTLGGYLFRPAPPAGGPPPAVIVLHGYGSDATNLVWFGHELARAGFLALCLSSRGWLGSTGDEDQGFRQPDDIVAVADWLRAQAHSVALLGFSQGGQVALLAAARAASAPFAACVAFYPCTDLAAWSAQTPGLHIAEYVEDFVPAERMAACSPVTVARQIRCPAMLVHGDQDVIVPVAQSRALVAANSDIRLRIVPGAGHGFPLAQWPDVWADTVKFLTGHA
jgi:dienelactone hydrolase